MNKGLEINVEIGLCTKKIAKENPVKDFEILIEEYKDKWSKQMYDYFKECLSIIEKELKDGKKNRQALRVIVKKANIRLFERNERYYFKTTNNLYEISKEKYDLLKEVLYDLR